MRTKQTDIIRDFLNVNMDLKEKSDSSQFLDTDDSLNSINAQDNAIFDLIPKD